MDRRISRSRNVAGTESKLLVDVGDVLRRDARADCRAVRWTARNEVALGIGNRKAAHVDLVEVTVGRALQRRVAREVGVKVIGAKDVGRVSSRRHIRVLGRATAVALELGQRPIVLARKESGFGAEGNLSRVVARAERVGGEVLLVVGR